jgi:predicted deacylase
MLKAKLFASAVALFVVATQALALDFDRYHSQDEINTWMRQLATDHPGLVENHLLGYSEQGREISYVTITKGDAAALPSLYLNGTHHGNEKSSTESVLAMIDYLIENRTQPQVAELLGSYVIYAQPLVNPDGHAMNRRDDGRGRDPNRDYSYPERGDADSFRVPSVRLVKELVDRVQFRAAIAYHSGMEGVLWPWCYSGQRSPEQDTFYTLSKVAAEAMGMSLYQQSYYDYPTLGEFSDYAYMTHGTLAVTFEVSRAGNPPASQLEDVVNRAIAGSMTYMLSVMDLDDGKLQIQRAPTPRGRPAVNIAAARVE